MEAAGMKRFFVVLVVCATAMVVTHAQVVAAPVPSPSPAPAPAPSPMVMSADMTSETSGAAVVMPTFAVGVVSVVMLLFGYLF